MRIQNSKILYFKSSVFKVLLLKSFKMLGKKQALRARAALISQKQECLPGTAGNRPKTDYARMRSICSK